MTLRRLVALVAALAAGTTTAAGHNAENPDRLLAAFQCIHTHEADWDADTGNGYYGGLQMDSTFERIYGREFVQAFGHASNWPPPVQLAVAMKAYLSGRGFTPWPRTARQCGLLQ